MSTTIKSDAQPLNPPQVFPFQETPFTPTAPPCRRCGCENGSNVQHTCLNGELRPVYNNWAFENILHQHFNRLRARLLNLAETSTRDRQQSDAMKGLIKDFCNEAYFPARREMEGFLRDKDVIRFGDPELREDRNRLNAQSLKDILYEPDPDAVR